MFLARLAFAITTLLVAVVHPPHVVVVASTTAPDGNKVADFDERPSIQRWYASKQIFRKNFFLAMNGIPHDMCMRASDRFCLNNVMKSVLNKNFEKAGFANDSKVDHLSISEILCGHNFVVFPRPDTNLFDEQVDFGGPANDDDEDEAVNAALGRTRNWKRLAKWDRNKFSDAIFRPIRFRLAADQEHSAGGRTWYGGAEMMGECDEGCDHQWAKNKNHNKELEDGALEATALQTALCVKLAQKCGSYFEEIKDCRIVFPGKRIRFPDDNGNEFDNNVVAAKND